MVCYNLGKYSEAADHFTKAMISNPDCDPTIRTAIALCYYNLKQYDLSVLAAQRSLALNVDVNSYFVLF